MPGAHLSINQRITDVFQRIARVPGAGHIHKEPVNDRVGDLVVAPQHQVCGPADLEPGRLSRGGTKDVEREVGLAAFGGLLHPHGSEAGAKERKHIHPFQFLFGGKNVRVDHAGIDAQAGGVHLLEAVEDGEVADFAHAAALVETGGAVGVHFRAIDGQVHLELILAEGDGEVAEDDAVQAQAVGRNGLVLLHRILPVLAAGDGAERLEQQQVVHLADVLLFGVAFEAAAFHQDGAGAPFLDVVAKGAGLEGVGEGGHLAGDVLLEHAVELCDQEHAALADRVDAALLVECRGQEGDDGAVGGVAGRVADALVMQVEAEFGAGLVAQALEDARFGGLELQGVAVHVDAEGGAALVALGAVGVEHGHGVDGQVFQDPGADLVELVVGRQEMEYVEQRHGGGGLVAVHLRPEQHRDVARANRQAKNLTSLGGVALLIERDGRMRLQGADQRHDVLVLEAPVVQRRLAVGVVRLVQGARKGERRVIGAGCGISGAGIVRHGQD
jgi:hypothetical protein